MDSLAKTPESMVLDVSTQGQWTELDPEFLRDERQDLCDLGTRVHEEKPRHWPRMFRAQLGLSMTAFRATQALPQLCGRVLLIVADVPVRAPHQLPDQRATELHSTVAQETAQQPLQGRYVTDPGQQLKRYKDQPLLPFIQALDIDIVFLAPVVDQFVTGILPLLGSRSVTHPAYWIRTLWSGASHMHRKVVKSNPSLHPCIQDLGNPE